MEVEEVVARAREANNTYLQEEWRARKREVLFGPGGLLIIGALLSLCVAPTFGLDLGALTAVVMFVMASAAGWAALRWRCPRCERVPLEPRAILAQKTLIDPARCPHCGMPLLKLPEDERGEA